MRKTMIKKLCAISLAVVLGMTAMVGCGSSTTTGQAMIHNLGSEVKTIDPALNTASDGSTIIVNAFEGLCKLNDDNKPEAGAAESWDISEDKMTYTFHLREDAKWSDGQDVKASDFEYAWKRVLNPATASDYAYQLYYIKGAEDYNTNKGSVDSIGIKAIDDKTLEVQLVAPTSYFLDLTTQAIFMPLRQDAVEANPDTWSTNPESYISNGAFKLKEYNMKDSYVLEKNENYYDKDQIKLDSLTFKMISDETSAYASLKNGEITSIDNVPTVEIETGKQDGLVQVFENLGTYFYVVNVGKNTDKMDAEAKKALSKKEVRQALNLAINRRKVVDEVSKGGQVPSFSFVPAGITLSDGSDFSSKKYWDGEKFDVEGAKALLAKAGYPNGEGLPTLTLTYNSTDGNKKIAEAVQQMWAEAGIKCSLQNEEWSVFQDTRKNGNYEVARHGWSADYIDPMTFLDMWITGSGNNDAGFSNAKYDELIEKAKLESDEATRMGYLREAEDILVDEMPVLPIYNYTSVKGIAKKAKGIKVSPLGHTYFDKAYIEE